MQVCFTDPARFSKTTQKRHEKRNSLSGGRGVGEALGHVSLGAFHPHPHPHPASVPHPHPHPHPHPRPNHRLSLFLWLLSGACASPSPDPLVCEDKDPQRCQLELATPMDKIRKCGTREYVINCELSCGLCPAPSPPLVCEDKHPQRCQLELTTLRDKIVKCFNPTLGYVRDCELSCGLCPPSPPPPSPPSPPPSPFSPPPPLSPSPGPPPPVCEDKDPQRCQSELTTLVDKIHKCDTVEENGVCPYLRDCELSCELCSP